LIATGIIACLGSVRAWGAPPAQAGGGAGAIFMYHHVSTQVQPGRYARALTVTPLEFEKQLRWLRDRGCAAVTVDQLVHDTNAGSVAACEVALTFDDGYADVVTIAAPMLRRYGDRATFYIATGYVGATGHVDVAQLRALHGEGMEIGAHTVHHVDLTKLPPERASQEIESSALALRGWIGVPISSFAYPSGRVDAAVMARVQMLGFDNAVTTRPGYVTQTSAAYELPRYRIKRGTGLALMTALLRSAVRGNAPESELEHIARERAAGNDPQAAEAIAVALLARKFPEQILKVHVLASQPATVAGIVLSGVKFHRAVNRDRFAADVREMVELAFEAAPSVHEVDVWATVPLKVAAGTTVSGDYAEPTAATVFSAAIARRPDEESNGGIDLGRVYWDPHFLP
jgi:peptidoglycan/xylan/chitin deacetylase (PgdA/CDA1 family)